MPEDDVGVALEREDEQRHLLGVVLGQPEPPARELEHLFAVHLTARAHEDVDPGRVVHRHADLHVGAVGRIHLGEPEVARHRGHLLDEGLAHEADSIGWGPATATPMVCGSSDNGAEVR